VRDAGPPQRHGSRWRRALQQLLTERSSPAELGVAVAVGVFIAVTPLYGLHLAMALVAATLFRLNRSVTILATNFPLPIFQPLLALGGLQIGAFMMAGEFLPVSMETIASLDIRTVVVEWLVGTAILGGALGGVLGLVTFLAVARRRRRE
jgi:uncharacterized protein (DUF2062 family)